MRSTHGIERSEIQELDLIHLTAKKHTAVVSVSPFVTLYNIGGHCTTDCVVGRAEGWGEALGEPRRHCTIVALYDR